MVNKPKIASEMLYNVKSLFAPHEIGVPISRFWKVNILPESDMRLQELEFIGLEMKVIDTETGVGLVPLPPWLKLLGVRSILSVTIVLFDLKRLTYNWYCGRLLNFFKFHPHCFQSIKHLRLCALSHLRSAIFYHIADENRIKQGSNEPRHEKTFLR